MNETRMEGGLASRWHGLHKSSYGHRAALSIGHHLEREDYPMDKPAILCGAAISDIAPRIVLEELPQSVPPIIRLLT